MAEDMDADFAAGFAEARGDEPPAQEAVEPEQQEELEAQPAEEAAAVEEDDGVVTVEEQPVIAGVTEEQLTSMLAKIPETSSEIRKVYGKIGELNQRLQALDSKRLQLSPEKMTRLRADYPELAEALAADLSEMIVPSGPQFDDKAFDERVAAVEEKIKRETELKFLTRAHRDWQTVVASDEFAVWAQTLPEEDQNALRQTWDSIYVSDKLDEFKAWKQNRQTATQTRQKRLEQAVTPQGTPATAPPVITEDDEFLAGWKAVRGK